MNKIDQVFTLPEGGLAPSGCPWSGTLTVTHSSAPRNNRCLFFLITVHQIIETTHWKFKKKINVFNFIFFGSTGDQNQVLTYVKQIPCLLCLKIPFLDGSLKPTFCVRNSTVGRVPTLHIADLNLIPGIPCSCLNTAKSPYSILIPYSEPEISSDYCQVWYSSQKQNQQ